MSYTASPGSYAAQPPQGLWQRLLNRWAQKIIAGKITIYLPGDQQIIAQGAEAGPDATIVVNNGRPIWRMLMSGDIGFFESYLDGDWSTPDLTALLELGAANQRTLQPTYNASFLALLKKRMLHKWRANTRRGSRKNIAFHYDLGNEFYGKWLDKTMTYSAAMFKADKTGLEAAQTDKYNAIATQLDLRAGQHILEIGCGWGGFAVVAARDYGCKVTCLTLSKEQKAFAEAVIAKAGLADKVEFRLQDYRDVHGQFDKIVSIEMFEAVGEENWDTYFSVVRERLKPGGQALLQIISIHDDRFDRYKNGCDFIQKYVFPGGFLPAPKVLRPAIAEAGLTLQQENLFGQCYAQTLKMWRERFESAWEEIAPLGFDERFFKLWTYYLSYCEAAFRTTRCDVGHYLIQKT